MCSTAFRRRENVHYCSLGEWIWCSTVLRRRKLVRYCPQGEGNWCYTACVLIRRKGLVLLRFREKVDGAVLCSGEQ